MLLLHYRLPRHTGLDRGPADAVGDGPDHVLVEDAGDDVLFRQVLLGDDVGDGPGGGQLHRLVDLPGSHIQGAAEDAGERQQVVDLVGVVRAPRGQYAAVALGVDGVDLRLGVGHGENDAVWVHPVQVRWLE